MERSRILALDPGSKRIGVALSDELGWFAQPLETYQRRSLEADVKYVRDLVDRHEVGQVVMGLPVLMNGQPGTQAEAARCLIERLTRDLTVPVVAWDERFTTKAAERMLIDADVSREKRKQAVDRVAAALLLQSYLDSRSTSGGISGAKDRMADCRETDERTDENGSQERE